MVLGLFSALTHLATLTTLRSLFREQPTLAHWWVVLMICTTILLGVALIPTGYEFTNSAVILNIIPVICFFSASTPDELADQEGIHYNWFMILMSSLFFLVGYISRIIRLFANPSETTARWMRIKLGDKLKGFIFFLVNIPYEPQWWGLRMIAKLGVSMFLSLYVPLKVKFDISQSIMWEVSCACFK